MAFNKFWMAVLITIVQALWAGLSGDHHISMVEGFAIAIAAVNAIIVVIVPNLAGSIAVYAKSITAALMAGLLLAVDLIDDGSIDGGDWTQILIAAVGAAGIYAIPNGVPTPGARAGVNPPV